MMSEVMTIQNWLDEIDWEDAFIKAMQFTSPTDLENGSIVAPSCMGDLVLHLKTLDPNHPDVRLKFLRVHSFKMSFCHDIKPRLATSGGRILLRLLNSGEIAIESEEVVLI